MWFLVLCYCDMEKFASLSNADLETLVRECKAYDEALSKSNEVIARGCLSHPFTWKCVRPANGRQLITDGPYSDANGQVSAFLIIEASDMDEAIRVASMHPAAHEGRFLGGGIEVAICELYEQCRRDIPLQSEDSVEMAS